MTKSEFVAMLLREIAEKGWTHKEAAKNWGISAPYLSDILKGNRDPGTSILDEFGMYKAVSYEVKDTSGVRFTPEPDFIYAPRTTTSPYSNIIHEWPSEDEE